MMISEPCVPIRSEVEDKSIDELLDEESHAAALKELVQHSTT